MNMGLLRRVSNCVYLLGILTSSANVFGIGSRNHTKSQEELLLQEIFGNNRDFNSLVPKYQLYSNDPLVILFNVTIFHVYYISWQNDLIKWNDSFGINRLSVAASKIWTPALVIEQNVQKQSIGAQPNDTVFLDSNGLNTAIFFNDVTISCEPDVCYFPRDNKTCKLTFSLKSYNNNTAVLRPKMLSKAKSSKGTGTWIIEIGVPRHSTSQHEEMTDHHISALEYDIAIERRPLFYVVTTVIPMLLLSIIASTSSILPAATGDRIALLITCMLAIIVYIDTLFKYLPESSERLPLIVVWLITSLIYMTVQIFLSSICLNWANKEENNKKPGKKATFFVFYFLKFIVTFVPNVVQKVRQCAQRKENNSIKPKKQDGRIADDAPQNQENNDSTIALDSSSVEEEQADQKKNFMNAIKIIDNLAVFLSFLSFAITAYLGFAIYYQLEINICRMTF